MITLLITPAIYLYLDRWLGTGPMLMEGDVIAHEQAIKPAMED